MSRVALIGDNSIEYIDVLLDIWNNGDCAVLIDWRIPLVTSVQMMREAGVGKCYIEKKFLENVSDNSFLDIKFILFETKHNPVELLPKRIYDKYKSDYSTNEAIVVYSSGTTGKSKGIILSHFAISTNADAIIDYMKPTSDDCIYIAKTLVHSSTLTGELLVSLKTHMRIIIASPIIPPRLMITNLNKYGVTVLCLNPTLLSIITDEVERSGCLPEKLKSIYVSGSILNNRIYEKAHRVLRNIEIYNVYGLTEAGPRVTAQRANCCKGNSVGKAICNVEVVIVNEQGNELPCGQTGMIHVNSPSLFLCYVSGYYKHKSFYQNWLNTGDIGFFDSNEELHIIGRQDDVIIIESHKIYPSEIEDRILQNLDVTECAVVDIQMGDRICLACLYVGQAEKMQLLKELRNRLPLYEVPRLIVRCENIPKNRNGKVSRQKIRKIIKEG